MTRIVNKLRYDTETAKLIADNEFSDGSNRMNTGRATYLYRTKAERFFVVHLTQWQGEHDSLEPVTLRQAMNIYNDLHNRCDFADAFPGVTVKEA